jgi:dienelactone hydrolase
MPASTITISTDDSSFNAYPAQPDSPKAPAIVVLQGIFGVDDH